MKSSRSRSTSFRNIVLASTIALTSVPLANAQSGNPLVQHKQAESPFAGTFSGEGLKLDLTFDAAKSQYSGTLSLNNQSFPCTGTAAANKLSGSFTAGGQSYKFDATLNGDAIALVSDGVTHALKREATTTPPSKNPLAQNPIAPQPPAPPQPPAAPAGVGSVGIAFAPQQDGSLVVEQILKDGPADKAKLKPGGVLRAVDGKGVTGKTPPEIGAMIRGPIGSMVTLTIETKDEIQDVILIRADLQGAAPPNAPNNPNGPVTPNGPVAPGPNVPGGNVPPQGPQAQAPAWMKPGTRVTFWSGSATIPGARQSLEPDENGNWVNKDTGQRFSPQDINGSGASGYLQLTINDVRDGGVICGVNNWGIDPQTQGVTNIPSSGMVIPLNAQPGFSDYWLSPAILQAMPEQRTGEVRAMRMQYPLNGKNYNAIRLQTHVAGGWMQNTYDLDTGLAISIGSCTITKAVATPGDNGQAGQGAGATMITQAFLMGTREVKLPWLGQTLPQQFANLKQVTFNGVSRLETNGVGASQWPVQVVWDIVKMTPSFAQARVTSVIDYQNGMQPIPNVSDWIWLTPSFYIDPRLLGQLKPNQVLDEDPITKARIYVQQIGPRQLGIVQQSTLEATTSVYDTQSGEFLGVSSTTKMQLGSSTMSVQVTGKR